MKVFTKEEFLSDVEAHAVHMKYGSIFIYPTDTLYGIGCDARNNALVQRIRRIKNSYKRPFSIIAPSKEWIREKLKVKKEHEEWLDKLPGPYTLIFECREKGCVSKDINPVDDTVGVRIPDNWFSDIVKRLGFPIITTSINRHGEEPCDSIKDVSDNISHMVDIAIDDGVIKGKPSTLVNLTKSPPEVIKR
jgi:tRNA threonylcarbamoyl adenosine modification protein (Sua5/YciO/YrdC/YwlC family)